MGILPSCWRSTADRLQCLSRLRFFLKLSFKTGILIWLWFMKEHREAALCLGLAKHIYDSKTIKHSCYLLSLCSLFIPFSTDSHQIYGPVMDPWFESQPLLLNAIITLAAVQRLWRRSRIRSRITSENLLPVSTIFLTPAPQQQWGVCPLLLPSFSSQLGFCFQQCNLK